MSRETMRFVGTRFEVAMAASLRRRLLRLSIMTRAGRVARNSLPLDIRSAPTLSTILSHVLTSLTNCFAEYEQRTFYVALLVTIATLLSYYYQYYY